MDVQLNDLDKEELILLVREQRHRILELKGQLHDQNEAMDDSMRDLAKALMHNCECERTGECLMCRAISGMKRNFNESGNISGDH